MFEAALKGTRTKGSKGGKKMKTFGMKDTKRWQREGNVQSMMKLKKSKIKVW